MSNPIDQEREAFELTCKVHKALGLNDSFLNIIDTGNGFERFKYGDTQKAFETIREALQSRAAVQPAGGAVPEGWKLVPIEPTDEMLQSVTTSKHEGIRAEVMRMAGEDYRTMLAAAPHPVSGEQTLDQHNAAYWQEQYELLRKDYQRSLDERAQDADGLVEALKKISAQSIHDDGGEWSAEVARAALAAHRAQQGEQPS